MRPVRLVRILRAQQSRLDPLQSDDRPDAAFEAQWRRTIKQRVSVILAVVGIWVVGLEGRLLQLQVFQHEELAAKARRYQERKIKLEALRGDIVDRNGNLLAYSAEADSIGADPSVITEPVETAAALCAALGDCTDKSRRELGKNLAGEGRWEVVRRARDVSAEQIERVRALHLPGVLTQSETRRYYPRFDLASHVVGFVGDDSRGQAGVEYVYNAAIQGEDGAAYVQFDAKKQRLESRVQQAPAAGARLELSLDLGLQHIVERELKAGVEENRAAGGTAIVMDPTTGEVLALANYPTFNPNAVGRSRGDDRRNRATQDVYEPGSTFKIVTASAALEEGIVRPDELIDTNPGYITFPGRKPVTEASRHNYGVLSFEDVIVKSSNVGAIKIGLRTGAERLTRYVHRFGFGEALARDFVGQSRGIWNPAALNDSGLASVSMGYQVSVTPLQMATAASAVANGGLLMEPHVVRAVVRNGRREVVQPKVLRRAISPETAAAVTTMMEGVVSARGTAKTAALDSYQVAGKTGTASKATAHGYSDTDYNASFIGFVPSRRPAFTILVVIDTPRARGYYGGPVAGPIFKRIAEAALQQRGVPPSVAPTPPVLFADSFPVLPSRSVADPVIVAAMTPVGGPVLMPDVRGLGARESLRILSSAGLSVRTRGDGFVVSQSPEPGEPVDPGGIGVIELARREDEAGYRRSPR